MKLNSATCQVSLMTFFSAYVSWNCAKWKRFRRLFHLFYFTNTFDCGWQKAGNRATGFQLIAPNTTHLTNIVANTITYILLSPSEDQSQPTLRPGGSCIPTTNKFCTVYLVSGSPLRSFETNRGDLCQRGTVILVVECLPTLGPVAVQRTESEGDLTRWWH